MKMRYSKAAGMVLASCVFALGCGDDSDATLPNGAEQDKLVPAEASLLEVFMHQNLTKIYLEDMLVLADPLADDYDLYVAHTDGPTFELGSHVQAINLGNEQGYHEIEELPLEGYAADAEDLSELVIGTSYRSGGSGSTGFIMSENIYALRLDHGEGLYSYAKIEVLQAMAGEVHVLAYHQPDGSTNVLTEAGPGPTL